jgi:hypothetical protein
MKAPSKSSRLRNVAKSREQMQSAAVPAKPYEPTEQERATMDALFERQRQRSPALRMKRTDEGSFTVDHADLPTGCSLALQALGLTDGETYRALINQIINAATKGKDVDMDAVNSMLGMVQAIEPRDTLEAMLATQMAAVHFTTMTFARRLNHVDTIPQQDSASNAFNKLARTFAAQIEALNRHRGKGQQQVTVTHMHVHDGGQAIVAGNVQGGGASSKPEARPHAQAIAHAPVTPLPSKDTQRETVSEPDCQREETLPNARRC